MCRLKRRHEGGAGFPSLGAFLSVAYIESFAPTGIEKKRYGVRLPWMCDTNIHVTNLSGQTHKSCKK
jgi:hypothetical protein